MASIYDIKPAFQNLLRPLTRGLAAAGVTANQVTVLATALSLATGTAIALFPAARWPLLVMPGFLFLRMALNAIDGMLAREHGQKSRLGALLNECGDAISDTALYLPLALVPGFDPRLIAIIVALALVTEIAGLAALLTGSSRRYDGPMGKSDRAFVFGCLSLAAGLGLPLAPWLTPVLGIIIVLLILTTARRIRRALGEAGPPS
ncbi:CDP-alcohol phosphatidyltransferase family protein [Luteolibacter arcticus]|uniref:CDP-alcohol phosphatidyltransferase family protein n=1 Tax=Luteolibacter arcticus TaxID=1581411 RepID=A0ABT3GJ11_9BACT|nr:CDP-alcohol phosphatidyltransferase family protein [Luteolibacter arcticus]MCW1923497.1 CDP-alcohol phosphatidyltransferase family protein [Luteolibacter arcticus]